MGPSGTTDPLVFLSPLAFPLPSPPSVAQGLWRGFWPCRPAGLLHCRVVSWETPPFPRGLWLHAMRGADTSLGSVWADGVAGRQVAGQTPQRRGVAGHWPGSLGENLGVPSPSCLSARLAVPGVPAPRPPLLLVSGAWRPSLDGREGVLGLVTRF